jgi:GcrA cell cycle regulator
MTAHHSGTRKVDQFGWTDEQVTTLTRLYAEGLSASQIAKKLGRGCTRNTVSGKLHRLKQSHEKKL